MSGSADLAPRFRAHVRAQSFFERGQGVLIAVSGGLDSAVLLHLLRFALPDRDVRLCAVHVDHAMRPGSAADAQWVAGLCRAWDVPLATGRLAEAPRSEDGARSERYAVFEAEMRAKGLDRLATAHHADDQAETVLFRAVRGSGLRGLAGIPARRDGWVVRPLLPFYRTDLVTYAKSVGLTWRSDPTNDDVRLRRNAVRHRVLPALEREVASGARASLVALADHARHVEETLTGLAEVALGALTIAAQPGRLVLDRSRVAAMPEAARAELLRAAARQLGSGLSRAGTRLAVEVSSPDFGRGGQDLGRGIHLSPQYEDLVMQSSIRSNQFRSLELPPDSAGEVGVEIGGRSVRVRWSRTDVFVAKDFPPEEAAFHADDLPFPLRVRGWEPGDRIRLSYGSKKVTRVFQEARVPAWRREQQPLLVDGEDRVLWVPGLSRSHWAKPSDGSPSITVQFTHPDLPASLERRGE